MPIWEVKTEIPVNMNCTHGKMTIVLLFGTLLLCSKVQAQKAPESRITDDSLDCRGWMKLNNDGRLSWLQGYSDGITAGLTQLNFVPTPYNTVRQAVLFWLPDRMSTSQIRDIVTTECSGTGKGDKPIWKVIKEVADVVNQGKNKSRKPDVIVNP